MINFLLLGFVDDLKAALFAMSHRDIVLEPEVVPEADLLDAPSMDSYSSLFIHTNGTSGTIIEVNNWLFSRRKPGQPCHCPGRVEF